MTSIETLHHAQSALIDSLNATGEQLERLGGHELTLALANLQSAAESAKARMTSAVEQMHQVLADVLEHVQALTRGVCTALERAVEKSPFPCDDTSVVEPPVDPTPVAHEPASVETTPESPATPDAVDATAEASTGTVEDPVDQPSLFTTPASVPEVTGTAEIVSVAANTCTADPDTLAILPEDSGRPARRKGKSRR